MFKNKSLIAIGLCGLALILGLETADCIDNALRTKKTKDSLIVSESFFHSSSYYADKLGRERACKKNQGYSVFWRDTNGDGEIDSVLAYIHDKQTMIKITPNEPTYPLWIKEGEEFMRQQRKNLGDNIPFEIIKNRNK